MFRNDSAKKVASGTWSWLRVLLFPVLLPLKFLKTVTEAIWESEEGSITVGLIFLAVFLVIGGVKGCSYLKEDENAQRLQEEKRIDAIADAKAAAMFKAMKAKNVDYFWYDIGTITNENKVLDGIAVGKDNKVLIPSTAYCAITFSKFGTLKFQYQSNTALCESAIVKDAQAYLKQRVSYDSGTGPVSLCINKSKCFPVNGEMFIDPASVKIIADPFAKVKQNVQK